MNKVRENLEEVKAEAKNMLDTLAAVKGQQYSEVVRVLLLCKQMADIGGMLCQEAAKENPALVQACSYGMSAGLSQIAVNQRIIAGMDDKTWEEAIADVSNMISSVQGLMRHAVVAGQDGKGFGNA